MADFAASYLGRLRAQVGSQLLLLPGARIVIEDAQGRILLQLRSDYQLWGLPGGIPDERESISDCVVRETLEETGLQVLDPAPFGFASDPQYEIWTYPNGDQCHYFTLLFYARSFVGGLMIANAESLRTAWFQIDDLPELMPVMGRTISAYQHFVRTGQFQVI
jgi:8-oxo-dGTP pyrophosphatase MutT (NUDIX family)